jgi:YggT family protein
MRSFIALLDAVLAGMRNASFALLVVCVLLATLAWMVRARRVNSFGALARFVRRAVEPLLAPFDRRLARHGIIGATVPWWALLVVLLAMATAIFVVSFVREAAMMVHLSVNAGPRGLLQLAVRATFAALQLALLVRVVTSWIGGTYSAVGRLAFRLTEWFLAPLRSVLPAMGGLDLSPLIAYFLLSLIQGAFLTVL